MKAKTLKKIANTGVALVASATIVISPYLQKQEIPYTDSDLTNLPIYLEELEEIKNDYEFNFKNEELYQIISQTLGPNFTVGDLRNIKTLTLDSLSNPDLSDLKYLVNLNELTIKNSTIDLADLKYNQKLESLNIHFSSISNSSELPNSIHYLELVAINVLDNNLYIPYNTIALRMFTTFFTSFTLKNPTSLIQFEYDGYSILDLNDLSECCNLMNLFITKSPNIKNAQVLSKLPSLVMLELDDFAPIWLDKTTLYQLDCLDKEQKETLLSQIKKLDKIAKSLVPYEMPAEDKVKSISLNVASRLEYDLSVSDGTELSEELATMYNTNPITCALTGKGVCMNYACLFTALANRVGLDNYQDFSLDHTWNLVKIDDEYTGFDITNLDKEYAVLRNENNEPYANPNQSYTYYFKFNEQDSLYYFNFNPDQMNKSDYTGLIEEPTPSPEYNIGYVSSTFARTKAENLEIRKTLAQKMLPLIPIQLINNIILTIIDKKQSKRKVKKS